MPPNKKRIIIDCDPGIGDVPAIMVALASNKLDVVGITTVAGNQTGEKTYKNTLKILGLLGRTDVPVARGFDGPLVGQPVTAPYIHGESGLGDVELPEPRVNQTGKHAVDFIVEKALEQKIWLVPIGPLTNIAVALLKEPKIKRNIEKIVMMGGAIHDSNVTPAAEFNIYVDPEAAKIVFESGIPIVMVGLDVTNRALLTQRDIDQIERLGGRVSQTLARLLRYNAEADRKYQGFRGASTHDPLAVEYLIDQSVLTLRPFHVDIETRGEYTRGQTVVDVYGVTKKPPNAEVAVGYDHQKFRKMIFDAAKHFDQKQAGRSRRARRAGR